jgi:LysM repeat protein
MIALRNQTKLRLAIAFGLLAVAPTLTVAQETAQVPKTHTVKKGDTLWDLAALYLGDAFRWPELYRLNTDVVEDPHWIYPGEILKLPGYLGTELPGLAQPGRDTVGVTVPTVVPIDSSNLRPAAPRTPTAFSNRRNPTPARPAIVDTTVRVADTMMVAKAPTPIVRWGDLIRAPYIDRLKGPPVWGRIIGAADLPGIDASRQRGRFQLNDRLLIAPPTGSVSPEGDQYLAYRYGPMIEEVGQVIIPTGVIEVIRPPVNGDAAIARVVRMFGNVSERDRLMPYDNSLASIVGTAMPIKNGAEGVIRWIADEPVLPSPTYYIVMSLTSADVKPGDEIELFHPRKKAVEEGEYATPEVSVGKARVIRATPYGATAMIWQLSQPKVEATTTRVRVVGKIQ